MTAEQRERNAKLVAALRSGEYQQGRDCLRSGDKFCCLGVATDLAVKNGVVEWEDRDGHELSFDTLLYPPKAVVDYYGWAGDNPKACDGSNFANRNDQGDTFAVIANLFEKTYLGDANESTTA